MDTRRRQFDIMQTMPKNQLGTKLGKTWVIEEEDSGGFVNFS